MVAALEAASVVIENSPPVPLSKPRRVASPKRTEVQTTELDPKLTAPKRRAIDKQSGAADISDKHMLFKLLRKNASHDFEPDLSPSAPSGSCSSATPEALVPAAGTSAVQEKMLEKIDQLTGNSALQAVTDQASTIINPT